MKAKPRWMKSVLATANTALPSLPYARESKSCDLVRDSSKTVQN